MKPPALLAQWFQPARVQALDNVEPWFSTRLLDAALQNALRTPWLPPHQKQQARLRPINVR
jgi:hypothetical protein